MTRRRRRKNEPASVEGLPADWRKHAKALRRYGGETPATAIERCADDLEATMREQDETTFSLVEAAHESGYSKDHLGRLVREGKIPNAGRPNAPRILRRHLPLKAPSGPRLAESAARRDVSNEQIVQSIIDCIDSFQYDPQPSSGSPVMSSNTGCYRGLR